MHDILQTIAVGGYDMASRLPTILAAAGAEPVPGKGGLTVDTNMVILVWVTFFVLFALLYKFAFKRIVDGLDHRETTIRKSLDNADRLEKELAELERQRVEIIAKAESEAKAIIDQARKGAVEAARVIEEKARTDAQIVTENARRDIATARDSARAKLQTDSADMAIGLASKIIGANLDDARNRTLVDQMIGQMQGQTR